MIFLIALGVGILVCTFLFRFPIERFNAKTESLRIHAICKPSLGTFGTFSSCLSQELIKLMPHGLSAVFDTLNELLDFDPRFRVGCHRIVYPIGAEAYKRYASSSPSDVLVPDASACNYGFYHGFLISLIADSQDPIRAGTFCKSLGKEVLMKRPDAANQCYHGLGHGLFAMFVPEELPSTDRYLQKHTEAIRGSIVPALDFCEKIAGANIEGRNNCISGVFHDIAMPHDGTVRKIDSEDPLWFCRGFSAEVSSRCLGNTMQVVLDIFPRTVSLQQILSYVRRTYESNIEIMSGVVYRWGFAGHTSDEDIRECQSIEPALRTSCLEGIRTGIEQNAGSRDVYRAVANFCAKDILSDDERSACVTRSHEYFKKIYSAEDVRRICKELSPQYEVVCFE